MNHNLKTDPLNSLLANPITESIEVEIADIYAPILIDLNHLFGGAFECRAAVESYGVADVDLINENGLMFLSANPEARHGQSTRVAVSAMDMNGRVKVTTIGVTAVDLQAVGYQVA